MSRVSATHAHERAQSPGVVAIVGAGLMGHGIALVSARGGWRVRVYDRDEAVLAQIPERIRSHSQLLGDSAEIDVELCRTLDRAVEDCQLVIEAVPEDLQTKRRVVAELDRLAPDALIFTNTSVLRISEIAAGSARPERIVGTHWWNPPYLIPIVEIVNGEQTATDTTDRACAWLVDLGKTPVRVARDVPGFIGNRMQFALWREALSIVEDGICDPATVDLVARCTFGLRLAAVGPLENADFIGLDLTAAIMDYLLPSLSSAGQAPEIVREAVAAGNLGAKTGRGLLAWPDGARDATEQRLLAHLIDGAGGQREHDSLPRQDPSTRQMRGEETR